MIKFKKIRFHLICYALVIISVLTLIQSTASAANSNDYILIDSSVKIPIPRTYVLQKVINNPGFDSGFNGFNSPEDLFYSSQGNLFVADTNNNRIVKMSKDGMLLDVFYGPEDKPLKQPQGIFVEKDESMFIADTGNYRIVHLSPDGKFVEEFVKPDSELLPNDFIFDPTKVVLTNTGLIYALKGQSLMTIDAYNNFRGYMGQSKIGFNLRDVLIRIFASDEQKIMTGRRIASSYTNVTIDDDNMLYATTLDTYEGEIKKLNSIGLNIYKKYGKPIDQIISLITKVNFDDRSFAFGNTMDTQPHFVDLAVDNNGIITAVDRNTCNLFQYDKEGNLLGAFGRRGDLNGEFLLPISVAVDEDGLIYVLDNQKNNIQIFEPTVFIKTVHQAVLAYDLGDYNASYEQWEQALKVCENYELANVGMAKALYKQEKWTESMEQYKLAGDRIGYSEVFQKYRHSIFRGNFLYVILGFAFIMCLLGFLVVTIKKRSELAISKLETDAVSQYSTKNILMLSLGTIFHPIRTFDLFKKMRGNINIKAGFIILALLFLTRFFYIFFMHFPLMTINPRNANVVLELMKLILPVVTFVIAYYAVTAIVGGESKLDEIFLSVCFCMIPYIIINISLTLFSNIICRSEEGLFTFIVKMNWVWIIVLFLVSIAIMNNYTTKKTFLVATVSVCTVVLIWIVILLVLSLSAQLYEFFAGLVQEVRMLRV